MASPYKPPKKRMLEESSGGEEEGIVVKKEKKLLAKEEVDEDDNSLQVEPKQKKLKKSLDSDGDNNDGEEGESVGPKGKSFVGDDNDNEHDDSDEDESREDYITEEDKKFIVNDDEEVDDVSKSDQTASSDNDDDDNGGNGGDEGEKRKKKKKKRRVDSDDEEEDLDEEDVELIRENLGLGPQNDDQNRFKRIKKRVDDRDKSSRKHKDLAEMFTDDEDEDGEGAEKSKGKTSGKSSREQVDTEDEEEAEEYGVRRKRRGEDDADDLDDFVVYDEGEEEEEARGSLGAQVSREETRRRIDRSKKNMESLLGNIGISSKAWDDIVEIFGDGTDYDWALAPPGQEEGSEPNATDTLQSSSTRTKGVDGAAKKSRSTGNKLTDVYEPSEIKAKLLTEEDETVRIQDIPERFQLRGIFNPPADGEIDREAIFISRRTVALIYPEQNPPPYIDAEDRTHELVQAVREFLKCLRSDMVEVPFIHRHRRDYFGDIEPRISLDMLWKFYDLDIEWQTLELRRTKIREMWEKIQLDSFEAHEDTYLTPFLEHADSLETLADIQEYVRTRFGSDMAKFENEGSSYKKRVQASIFEQGKRKKFGAFAKQYGIDVRQFSQSWDTTEKTFWPEDPTLAPEVLVKGYRENESQKDEMTFNLARLFIAQEIATDPAFRRSVRDILSLDSVVTVHPTEKGKKEIDEHHVYYRFKYLKERPITFFQNSGDFLLLMEAEEKDLIKVEIRILHNEAFFNDVASHLMSDGVSEIAQSWNAERRRVLEIALNDIMFPVILKQIKDRLVTDSQDVVMAGVQSAMMTRVNLQPYIPPYMSPKEYTKHGIKVLAMTWGDDDTKTSTIGVLLNRDGSVLQTLKLDKFQEFKQERKEADIGYLKSFLATHEPDIIAISGFSPSARRLKQEVEAISNQVFEKYLMNGQDDDYMDLDEYDDEDDDEGDGRRRRKKKNKRSERDRNRRPPPVMFVEDDVARIYMNSKRSVKELPALPPLMRYCVSLGRKVLDPLAEYASLCNADREIAALKVHPLQTLVNGEKLMECMERSLVNVVNDVGCDLNTLVRNDHKQALLQFVAGLGRRKALSILAKLASLKEKKIFTREDLILKSMMGAKIFMNSASFIRIRRVHFTHSERDELDVLDDTRVHPEVYHLARQMATNALDIEEMQIEEQMPSFNVAELMRDPDRKDRLDALVLEDFAEQLVKDRGGKRQLLVLRSIRAELNEPYKDMRTEFHECSPDDVFRMLTGETDDTLYAGQLVNVTVRHVGERGIRCTMANGMEAWLGSTDLGDALYSAPGTTTLDKMQSMFAVNAPITAKVMMVDKPNLSVKLVMDNREGPHPRVDVEYWNMAAEEADKKKLSDEVAKYQPHIRRKLKFQFFIDVANYRGAEEYLRNKPRGYYVVRPSSNGEHFFSISWKVDEGLYQHIELREIVQNGKKSYVIGGKQFADLDEVHSRFMAPLTQNCELIFGSPKYLRGDSGEVERQLRDRMAISQRGEYGFMAVRGSPGLFALAHMTPGRPLRKEEVKPTPEGFFYHKKIHKHPSTIVREFKMEQAQKMTSAPRSAPGESSSSHYNPPPAVPSYVPGGGASYMNPGGR